MYNSNPSQRRSRSPDSWVEIPTGASTASILPSTGSAPLSAPTSRDVLNNARRRGRVMTPSPLHLQLPPRPSSVDGSSQEEYEESESESDRLMTSSNEALVSNASESEPRKDEAEAEMQEDERLETATAFGIATDQNCFTPQPNAFTHPPSSHSRQRSSVPGSYFPSASRTSASAQRHSYPGQRRQSHTPLSAISPNHQPDHDAALRASLTTLLSLGAAARGLPKKDHSSTRIQAPVHITRGEKISLRTVPESVALGLDRPTLQPRRISSTPSSSNPAPSPAVESFALRFPEHQHSDRQKRKAARSSSKDRDRQRLAKKPRRLIIEDGVSPTLLTWVVSAGVLVLVSALSFSAGYKVGQETARFETGFNATETGSCAKEATRSGMGLRRLRWSSAANAVSV